MIAHRDFFGFRKVSDRETAFPTAFSSTFSPIEYSKLENVTPLRSRDRNWPNSIGNSTEQSQTNICNFFTGIASNEIPEEAIEYFKGLFILKNERVGKKIEQSLYDLLVLDCEEDFFILLDRCCCILIKQWLSNKQERFISLLLNLLQDENLYSKSLHPTRRKLKDWVANFVRSKYFRGLQLFLPNNCREIADLEGWPQRYRVYSLMAKAFDPNYPQEHREVAKLLGGRLEKQFKFKLALCLAHANLPHSSQRIDQNPTHLNLRTLCLIQQILVKRNNVNYRGVANIFLKQTDGIQYKDFKQSLLKYLLFSLRQGQTSTWLQASISNYLEPLYAKYDDRAIDNNLLLRTCRRLMGYLLHPNWESSSHPLTILTNRGNNLTLAILLLKIVLICPSSYKHLIFCTVALIEEHKTQPEAECQWLVGFLETLRVVLTISSNTQLVMGDRRTINNEQ